MEFSKQNNTHLWNELPSEERHRLMPYMIESQILHIEQVKKKAMDNHKKFIAELDAWIKNLKSGLKETPDETE